MVKASRRRLAQTIVRLMTARPSDRAAIITSLAAYLIETKQTKQTDLLVKDIARELSVSHNMLMAEVQSAYALNDSTRQQLKDYLKRATGAKQVELSETVEPELLSGVIVRTSDQELDTTARRQLKQLASLNSGGIK
jgi:F-type H+-transporting ATPase subunit delta